jgi:tungstate transport system ATP-binding protein
MLYSLRDIKVHRGERCILDIAKLDITAGKVYSLVGPNGAGKSTLLNILGFLMRPDGGIMACNDVLVQYSAKTYQQLRQNVVLVEQYPILFTGPVWRNIDFALKIRKISRQQRITRIGEVLELVGMQTFADADAHKLSGGETKRIALARALAIEPEVLLCDEPTANVDTENQERIIEILGSCNKQQKTSLIFATHYLSQAQRLADCSIALQNGSVSTAGNDNIFTIHRVDGTQPNDMWQAGDGLSVIVPGGVSITGQTSCKIQIDPKFIAIARIHHSPPPSATQWNGKIIRIASESEGARITVDCGVRVDVFLSHKIYIKEQYTLQEHVSLEIPVKKVSFFQ